jgi:hypothetical protein
MQGTTISNMDYKNKLFWSGFQNGLVPKLMVVFEQVLMTKIVQAFAWTIFVYTGAVSSLLDQRLLTQNKLLLI